MRFALGILLALLTPLASAAEGVSSQRGFGIELRKRLHVNTLITEPDTVELEFGELYSSTSGNFSLPSLIKYTPEGRQILWGRTEYSMGFDSVFSELIPGGRTAQFSDRVTLSANVVVFDG